MSTTLSVLHVLMAGPGRDDAGLPGAGGLLVGGGGMPELDPQLQRFWSSFPCPPPWNRGLLFRVNWTACVGQLVGERLKWFMADRCNIPHDGVGLLDDGGEGMDEGGAGEEEMEAAEACAVPCIIMIALASLVFALLVAAFVFCVCRKRPKNTSPSHLSPLNSGQDNAKYYTSCHYASAPVMSRPLETALRGRGTETRLLEGGGSCSSSSLGSPLHQLSPYHHHHHHHLSHHQPQQQLEHRPLLTPQHRACGHRHHHPHHDHPHHHNPPPPLHSPHHLHNPYPHLHPSQTTPFHLPAAQLLVNLNGQTSLVRPHPGDLCLGPVTGGSGGGGNYRRLVDCLVGGGGGSANGNGGGGEYTSSSAASERSHTYESIGEGQYYPESLKNGLVVSASINGEGGVTTSLAGKCAGAGCGVGPTPGSTPQPGGIGPYPVAGGPYSEPEFCDCGCAATAAALYPLPYDYQAALDGYYNDRGTQTLTQTLPLRHFRPVTSGAASAGVAREEEEKEPSPCPPSSFPSPFSPEVEDSSSASTGGAQSTRPSSRQSTASRRRTSSGSHYSERSSGTAGSGYGSVRDGLGQRRNIPALHPNYFDPPEPAAPDTFQS